MRNSRSAGGVSMQHIKCWISTPLQSVLYVATQSTLSPYAERYVVHPMFNSVFELMDGARSGKFCSLFEGISMKMVGRTTGRTDYQGCVGTIIRRL